MDKKLTWGSHMEYARATRAKLYPMTSRTSKLALRNKVTLIKSVLQSHLKKLQAVENIALRTAVDAPWYVRNVDIQRDMQVHHPNGKDRTERSEDIPKSGKQRKLVTARSSELRPGADCYRDLGILDPFCSQPVVVVVFLCCVVFLTLSTVTPISRRKQSLETTQDNQLICIPRGTKRSAWGWPRVRQNPWQIAP